MEETPRDQMLRSMCQFFSLSDEDKLRFLPPVKSGSISLLKKRGQYVFCSTGERTDNPLFYYCNAAFELMDRYRGGRRDEFADVITEIHCVLNIMIGQRLECFYIWKIDPNNPMHGITGGYDKIWDVLRRLSREALHDRHWREQFPEIPFSETTWSGTRGLAGV